MVFLGRRDTTDDKPEEQLVEGIYDGRLLMLVETDRSVYQYDDYIYVTATMINLGDEAIRFSMPTKTRGIHKELMTRIENGNSWLIDVDMYWYWFWNIDHESESGEFVLEPSGCYVQNMRFSTQTYQNGVGDFAITNEQPESGAYKGSVTANVVTGDGIEEFTVEFDIVIEEKQKK